MFKNLEEKMTYYRGLSDIRLMPKSPVMLMLDGRSFSKYCKKFEKPYSKKFISMMNDVASYLCNNISNAVFAYVQSDEISIFISDEGEKTDAWFGNRVQKLCSIASSMASSKFNQLAFSQIVSDSENKDEIIERIKDMKLAEFDCKAWSLPNVDTVYEHFLWRQRDCIRNSKQMLSQYYFSHNKLQNKTADEQVEMVKNEFGKDWNDFERWAKYGRFIYKSEKTIQCDNGETKKRMKFEVHDGFDLSTEAGHILFFDCIYKVLNSRV